MKLSDILETPRNWSPQNGEEVQEVELLSYSSEYQQVRSKLSGTALNNLERVTRVQNPFLYHRYKIRKLEYEALNIPFSEIDLLHATGASKITSIIKDNLDWRCVNRAKFGKGVSFSPFATYANKECSKMNGYSRAIIVANVLVGNKCCGSCFTTFPPKGYDSTYGNGNNVIVKYYDDEFYPAYVAYYHL